jgi:L-threonylcarbamoyladenylate synthase
MRSVSKRLIVQPEHPAPAAMQQAAEVIAAGGVVAFPTDTLYGLAADPFNARAVQRVFEIKGRSDRQPLALVAADLAQVEKQIGVVPEEVRRVAGRFWPGALTLLLEAPAGLAPGVAASDNTVGVRVPAHDVARALCRASERVLTATSANRTGHDPFADPELLWAALGDRVDLMLDAGPTAGGAPSTIVDVRATPPRLVRAGAIDWEMITAWLRA